MQDLLIVGAGPAGLSAAIYAARAGMSFTILEQMAPARQQQPIILKITLALPMGSAEWTWQWPCRRKRKT